MKGAGRGGNDFPKALAARCFPSADGAWPVFSSSGRCGSATHLVMAMVKEFREFIARGNVIDLAVGVIIGGAFGKIVNSLVTDMIMPPIGALLKGVNFNNLYISLDGKSYESLAKAKELGAPVIGYGTFFNTAIEFLIIAACVFLLVKIVNKVKRTEPPAPAAPSKTEVLLEEIRDLLKK
jgi:large conductance mechanosensitive channel